MPRMTNGIGTWFCTAHFDGGWGWDDAVECAMFLYFPVWPLRVIHLQQIPSGSFGPEKFQAIPLRWSDRLVWRVFLRRWLAGSVGLGVVLFLTLGLLIVWPPKDDSAARAWSATKSILVVLAPCLIGAGIAGQLLCRCRGRRQRDMRRCLGVHRLGSSDPATWLDEDLARMPKAADLFATATYAEAVPKLLAEGAWVGAMWAARLTAACENRRGGEELTDTVLRHAGVQDALTRFQRDASCWREAMGVHALMQFQTQQLAEIRLPFELIATEQSARQQRTERQDQYVATVAAVFALIGVALGAWLGSMVNISIAMLAAVLGSVVGAAVGIFLGMMLFSGR